MKKLLIAAVFMGAGLSPVAAIAQDVAAPVAALLATGAKVYAADGSEVGTVEKIDGGNVVIFTGKNRATLPASSLGKNDKGLLIAMTREQLDSAVEAANAKADAAMTAALIPDAPIKSSDGAVIGKVQKVEDGKVTIDLPTGSAIVLGKDQMRAGADGLSLFMTAAQFNSAVSAATQPQDSASAQPQG